jgi:hypothetical protein
VAKQVLDVSQRQGREVRGNLIELLNSRISADLLVKAQRRPQIEPQIIDERRRGWKRLTRARPSPELP